MAGSLARRLRNPRSITYEKANISFRILPLFRGASSDQNTGFQIGGREVLDAVCQLFDLWLASPTRITISPLSDSLACILRRRGGAPSAYYDRRAWEELVIVNTNGDLYAEADAYRPGKSWGNVYAAPLSKLLGSPAWERSVLETETRMAAVCARCSYFGACRGVPIAEDTREYADSLDASGHRQCVVERGLYAHIERRIDEAEADPRFGKSFWQGLIQREAPLS